MASSSEAPGQAPAQAQPHPSILQFLKEYVAKNGMNHVAAALEGNPDLTGLWTSPANAELAAPAFHNLFATIDAYVAHAASSVAAEETALQQRIGQLQQELQQAPAQQQQLPPVAQEEIEMLKNTVKALSSRASEGGGTGSSRRLSRDPEPFSGRERDVSKRQLLYSVWRSQIKMCFVQDSALFNTPQRQILHVAALLKDEAYDANRTKFDSVVNNANPELWHWQSADDVFSELDKQFETMDLAQEAGRKFDNLFMGNKPFQNFISEFRLLAGRCNKSNDQLVDALKKKISPGLADALKVQALPAKDAFDEWCALCQRLYNADVEFNHLSGFRRSNAPRTAPAPAQPFAPAPSSALASSAPADDGDPMELDASRSREVARAHCIANGLCFYCKSADHQVQSCPLKRAADQRFPSFGRGRGRGGSGRGTPSSVSPRSSISNFGSRPSMPRSGGGGGPFSQLRAVADAEEASAKGPEPEKE